MLSNDFSVFKAVVDASELFISQSDLANTLQNATVILVPELLGNLFQRFALHTHSENRHVLVTQGSLELVNQYLRGDGLFNIDPAVRFFPFLTVVALSVVFFELFQ